MTYGCCYSQSWKKKKTCFLCKNYIIFSRDEKIKHRLTSLPSKQCDVKDVESNRERSLWPIFHFRIFNLIFGRLDQMSCLYIFHHTFITHSIYKLTYGVISDLFCQAVIICNSSSKTTTCFANQFAIAIKPNSSLVHCMSRADVHL